MTNKKMRIKQGSMKNINTELFVVALLSSEIGNTDKIVFYINECRRIGIGVFLTDVNGSNTLFKCAEHKE